MLPRAFDGPDRLVRATPPVLVSMVFRGMVRLMFLGHLGTEEAPVEAKWHDPHRMCCRPKEMFLPPEIFIGTPVAISSFPTASVLLYCSCTLRGMGTVPKEIESV